ncbi:MULTISPECIES: YicC/YloC family endoribonuclease [unclassified Sedimentibacter]|uniref:YicC/YloC family endoribonuclease n=1 Tax=unclassified Sedimentibacter TaxID=2649220 RepID=UPI0027E11FC2|nr:YicC/YloC family endoribonuclease [Sedimentibacter sp. MB35-C1]WMJ76044.1 YicC/YloC family endoribonuclease [Sedimentibacter sp. MB35-C1]
MANILSMTGYGKGEHNDGKRVITAEIKTINNRYCDISVKTPRHLRFFEDNIRKILKNSIQRGRIDVYISIDYLSESDTVIVPNLCLAKQYKDAIDEIKNELNISSNVSLDTIIRFQDVLMAKEDTDDEEELKTCVEAAMNNAVKNLIAMRAAEGKQLEADIRSSMEKILLLMEEISKNSLTVVEDYKVKFEARIKELLGNSHELDENRLYNEIVIYADKSDINEEIVRFKSHMCQLGDVLETGGTIGRKLDFIIQESNREINTIGSKIGRLEIIQIVVEIKNLLEKIREQVQNIE